MTLKLDQFLVGYDATDAQDKRDACDEMEPFKALLAAKTGKGITPAEAARWSADADHVADLAGC